MPNMRNQRLGLRSVVVLLILGPRVAGQNGCDTEESSMLQSAHTNGVQIISGSEPFQVDTLSLDGPDGQVGLKVLSNSLTDERVDIAWTFGGKVDALLLRSPSTGKLRNVLVSSNRNATRLLTMGWAANEFLVPFANRIENGTYSVNGKMYYMERNEGNGKNAIHGFLKGKRMRVVKEQGGPESASVTLAYDFNDPRDPDSQPQGYPFLATIELTYTLNVQGLTVTAIARNRANTGGALPFHMGMHPYFNVDDVSKSSLIFDSCSGWNQIEVDENLIPDGRTKAFRGFTGEPIGGTHDKPTAWDNGFAATASAVECSSLDTKICSGCGDCSVLRTTSPQFKFIQAFTGGTPSLGQVIAVEPMSGATNAFNNYQGLQMLQARQSWSGTFSFHVL